MVIVMMWLVLYDINYIYRRKTPRFVDYDEVEAGEIKQSFTFHLNDITRYKSHILQLGGERPVQSAALSAFGLTSHLLRAYLLRSVIKLVI